MPVPESGRRPPFAAPWYHGWNVIGVCILFQAATIGTAFYSFSFWIEPFKETFQVETHSVLLIATCVQFISALYAVFVGRLLDTQSVRLLITGGVLAFSLGTFLVALTTALWQVFALQVTLVAIGALLAGTLPTQVLTSRWFVNRRGAAMGMAALGTSVGGFVFPPIVASLMAEHGWRATNMIIAAGTAAILVPLVWFIIRDRRASDIEPGRAMAPPQDTATAALAAVEFVTTLQVLTNKNALILISWFITLAAVMIGFQMNLAPIAAENGVGLRNASFLVSAMSIAAILGKLAFGALSDRLDHRSLLLANVGGMAFALLGLAASERYITMMMSTFILGFSAGGMLPLITVSVAHLFGAQNIGRVIGLMMAFGSLAAVGPVSVGLLKEQFGTYDASLIVCVLVLAIPAVALCFFDGKGRVSQPMPSRVEP